jgi:tetratricopeptide (TPR) repeat protein
MCRLRLGLLDDATNDANESGDRILKKQISDVRSLMRTAESHEAHQRYEEAIGIYQRILKTCTSGIAFIVRSSAIAMKRGDRDQFTELSHLGMQVAPRYPELLELRGTFFLCDGENEMAIRHFKTCMSVASGGNNCTALLRSANAFFGNQKKINDRIKAKEYAGAEELVEICERTALSVCSSASRLVGIALALEAKLLVAQGRSHEALKKLGESIKRSPDSTALLLERAALLEQAEEYEDALKDYLSARRVDPQNKRAEEGVEKISKMQEKEKNVDFYEVLGVDKQSTTEEIKAAYKAQARKWHPDRFQDPAKKKQAEKMMKNLNRALDVLGDREKRAMYDQGVDPDSGMGPQNGGGPQFQQGDPFQRFGGFGGFHFGGGGFQGWPF